MPIQRIISFNDVYQVITNRQKVVWLRTLLRNVATTGSPYLSEELLDFEVLEGPSFGQLKGSAPNLTYVPVKDYRGPDSFRWRASHATYGNAEGTLSLVVADEPVIPFPLPTPEFGLSEVSSMYEGEQYDFVGAGGVQFYKSSEWGPYTHFVDLADGSDSGNAYGTEDLPRKTIPNTLAAGSVVIVTGVESTNPGLGTVQSILCSGSAELPIFVRGKSPIDKVVFKHAFRISGSYAIFEYIDIACDSPAVTTPGTFFAIRESINESTIGGDHICLRHSRITDYQIGATSGGVSAYACGIDKNGDDSATPLFEHNVVYDLEVGDFVGWDSFAGTDDYGGIAFERNSRNNWVLECNVYNMRGNGIIGSRNNGKPNHLPCRLLFVGGNTVHRTKEYPLCVKFAIQSVWTRNKCTTVRHSASSLGGCVAVINNDALPANPYPDDTWILFNEFMDCERGVISSMATNAGLPSLPNSPCRLYIWGNVFDYARNLTIAQHVSNVDGVMVEVGEAIQPDIQFNLFNDYPTGVIAAPVRNYTQSSQNGAVVRNNVFTNMVADAYREALGTYETGDLIFVDSNALPYCYNDHNIYWNDRGPIKLVIGDDSYYAGAAYDSLSALRQSGAAAANKESGSLQVRPIFRDYAYADYRPGRGSLVVGRGTLIQSVLDRYYSLFGVRLTMDALGNVRPHQERNPDIGPYESTATGVHPVTDLTQTSDLYRAAQRLDNTMPGASRMEMNTIHSHRRPVEDPSSPPPPYLTPRDPDDQQPNVIDYPS